MALIGLAQSGQILFLTDGPRGDQAQIRENVIAAGSHCVALHDEYTPILAGIRSLCNNIEANSDIREVLSAMQQIFTGVPPTAGVGAVVAGFQRGGNPLMMGFASGQEMRMFYPLVIGGGLPTAVSAYLMKNLSFPQMKARDGLDLIVLMGLEFAELLRDFGYPDAFEVARLRSGEVMEWLGEDELHGAIDRSVARLHKARGLMGQLLRK